MTRFKILAAQNCRQNIGILGGSFNPAHKGHVYISMQAMRRLNLDVVIWLITPQNPMKKDTKSNLDSRIEYAKRLTKSKRIIVSDIERYFSVSYTAYSVDRITKMHPNAQFTWIMGADNMTHINTWEHWQHIFELMDIAIFDRNKFDHKLKGLRSSSVILKHNLKDINFIKIRKNSMSSTELRNKEKCYEEKESR